MNKSDYIVIAHNFVKEFCALCGCPTPAIILLLNYISEKDIKKEYGFSQEEIDEALKVIRNE